MYRLVAAFLTVFCLLDADLPKTLRLRWSSAPAEEFPRGQELPVLPMIVPAEEAQKPQKKSGTLQPESRLALVRYVSGEFAHALKPLPAGKQGFVVKVGEPINEEMLYRVVASRGAAVNTGDAVQITRLEFRDRAILVDVNGGGRSRKRWRDRIRVETSGIPTVSTTAQNSGPPGWQPGSGSTIFLDFGRPLPDLAPDELKQLLAPILDFSKQRSAAVQWVDTLPPEIKKAIQERRPVLGMDREMVIAAIGKPERKVRERDADGNEIEDWIYGQPPSKTIFVRFAGDRVTGIRHFP